MRLARLPKRSSLPRPRVVIGVLAGVALVAGGLAMLPRSQSVIAGTRVGPEGTIRLAPDLQKQCQRLGFDNRNGEFRDRGVAPCEPQGSGDNSSVDRMQAIRAWFNRK